MAGIMIMDELSELNRKIATLEGEVSVLKSNRAGALETQQQSDQLVVSALSELAGRLEGLTAKLNGRAPVAAN